MVQVILTIVYIVYSLYHLFIIIYITLVDLSAINKERIQLTGLRNETNFCYGMLETIC